MDKLYLILENGMVFEGKSFGASGDVTGELVFNTSMIGYLEALTDPAYYGQILMQTFPLIGNYGVIPSDFESDAAYPIAYIAKYPCQDPSNFRSEGNLDTFLREKGIVGLRDIDTRALTKVIREQGTMNARITSSAPETVSIEEIRAHTQDNCTSFRCREPELYEAENPQYTVAFYDFGTRDSVIKELTCRSCNVWRLPLSHSAQETAALSPDGIVLSGGPGAPADYAHEAANIKKLLSYNIPVFGIGLGHQLLALQNGFDCCKLAYGHHGSNQPVRDGGTGRIYITGQNHGYAVSSDSIDSNTAYELFTNLHDNTCEGIVYKDAPVFSVQFEPITSIGPGSTGYLYDLFISNMSIKKNMEEM